MDAAAWHAHRQGRIAPDANAAYDGPGPLTAADVRAEPAMEQYPLPALPDGRVLTATTVNIVKDALLEGSTALVPWMTEIYAGLRQPLLPVAAVHRALLGIGTPYAATGNQAFRVRYATPVSSRQTLHPLKMLVRETAARNDLLSELGQQTTVALVRLAMATEQGAPTTLAPTRPRCHNRVFVTYMHRPVDLERLLTTYPHMAQREGMFDSATCRHPMLDGMRLMVNRRPLILVGAKSIESLDRAMRLFMPIVYDCCTPLTSPTAAAAALAPAKTRKRPRTATKTAAERATKRRQAPF
jgi:hypothetical protein